MSNGQQQTTRPPPGEDDDNEWHEVWWNSVADGDPAKSRPQVQLHEVWQWMGDAPDPAWLRCGEFDRITAEQAYAEGWRYVAPVRLHNREMRMDGEPPQLESSNAR